jgi:hypothetical protein
MCQCAMRLGAVILLTSVGGITADSHVVQWRIKVLAVLAKARDLRRIEN